MLRKSVIWAEYQVWVDIKEVRLCLTVRSLLHRLQYRTDVHQEYDLTIRVSAFKDAPLVPLGKLVPVSSPSSWPWIVVCELAEVSKWDPEISAAVLQRPERI